jgi:hypothetical protein
MHQEAAKGNTAAVIAFCEGGADVDARDEVILFICPFISLNCLLAVIICCSSEVLVCILHHGKVTLQQFKLCWTQERQ